MGRLPPIALLAAEEDVPMFKREEAAAEAAAADALLLRPATCAASERRVTAAAAEDMVEQGNVAMAAFVKNWFSKEKIDYAGSGGGQALNTDEKTKPNGSVAPRQKQKRGRRRGEWNHVIIIRQLVRHRIEI